MVYENFFFKRIMAVALAVLVNDVMYQNGHSKGGSSQRKAIVNYDVMSEEGHSVMAVLGHRVC